MLKNLVVSMVIASFAMLLMYSIVGLNRVITHKSLNWHPDGDGICASCWLFR